VEASPAKRLYVCNAATQPGETDGFDVDQHMSALQRHVGRGLFPFVLANSRPLASPEQSDWQPVALRYPLDAGYKVIAADVVDPAIPWRHDSGRLAEQVLCFYRGQEQGDGREAVSSDVV
jgi:2-phospho-L-lactate transferase/gluconeogenesis factor (CofD/UPF0052 family)